MLTILLLCIAAPVAADVSINTGGFALGNYLEDHNYSGGAPYTWGDQTGVYNTERWSTSGFSYAIPVTAGQVEVTLRIRESCAQCPYTRVFQVTAEGQVVVANYSLPMNTVGDKTFTVNTDATLNLVFTTITGEAWVNAIEVRQLTTTTTPPPVVTLSASPTSITSGSASTLNWSATNATSCTASGAWSGAKATSGAESTGTLLATSTYTLTCSGSGGSVSQSSTVTVAAPPPVAATGVNINTGGAVLGSYLADQYFTGGSPYTWGDQTGVYNTERWSTSNFSYAIPVTTGQVEVTLRIRESCAQCPYTRVFQVTAEGQVVVANYSVPLNSVGDKTFTVNTDATLNLVFTTITGEAWVNAIEVRQLTTTTVPPPVVTLSASPTSITSGSASTLNWSATNATSCTASGAWSGAKATSGAESTGALSASAIYTLACTGSGGSISQSVTVTVAPVVIVPTLTLSATPSSVASGSSAMLNWSATNATSCTASGAWSGAKATSGAQSTGALSVSATYTLACTGSGGSISQSVSVTVAPVVNVPSVTLSATPSSVASGGTARLTWSSTNVTSCTASGAWSGNKATSGSTLTKSLLVTRTYTLTCSGPAGSASRSTTVTVVPPPSLTFSASPQAVVGGSTSTLTWSSTNATSCTAGGAWSGTKATSGSETSGVLLATSTYTLACTGVGGSVSQSVTVTVTAIAPPPVVTLTASPTSVVSGSSATLTWNSTDATSCTAGGAWSGTKTTSGSQSTGALLATSSYTLTCSGPGGSASQSSTVAVTTPPTGTIPDIAINAGGSTLGNYLADQNYSGGSAYTWGNLTDVYNTERWSSTSFSYAIPVTAGQVEVTLRIRESCAQCPYTRVFQVTAEGQVVVANYSVPLNTVGDKTFTVNTDATLNLVFTTITGEAWVNAIEVRQLTTTTLPPPGVTLSASPSSITSGSSSTLDWSATNATSCTASGAWNGTKATSGSESSGALSVSSTYTLTCTGSGGSTSAMATVSVQVPSTNALFPLRVEPGSRYLIDAQGKPFLINGDTAWSLIVQLSRAEVDQYLEDRRLKGFNTILVNLIEHEFADNAPFNRYGDAPFSTAGNFATPNESYFAHADYVIAKAAEKGILVMLAPAYAGYGGGGQGWWQEMQANGATKLRDYGRYLGNRYRGYSNILWVQGGDYDVPDKELVRALVNGIRDVETTSLHTYHGQRGTTAREFFGTAEPWLSVNNIYTNPYYVVSEAYQEYAISSAPFFLIEAGYENDGIDARGVRTQAYQAVLSGAAGHLMGNNPIWFFNAPNWSNPSGQTWQAALDSDGSRTMVHLRTLIETHAGWLLQPDQAGTVLTAGVGSDAGHAPTAFAADRSRALIYTPDVRSLTINMGRFAGPSVTARWYDPTTGAYTAIAGSPFLANGDRTFTPKATNAGGSSDWVLVLESL